jgi:formamidopyrimidine-DNA glycosylase
MPEGPEIRHIADVLSKELSGDSIKSITILEKSRYIKTNGFKNDKNY